MKKSKDLLNLLRSINGKGYKLYKEIKGSYDFGEYILSIDSVQGDPFASPSRVRIIVNQKNAQFPLNYFDKNHKRIAVVDFLARLCSENINQYYNRVKGSGKSGVLSIDKCGEEILDRTAIYVSKDKVEARLEVGLPALGRKILSIEAEKIFFKYIPEIINKSLYFNRINSKGLKKHIELIEDQEYIRDKLKELKMCAFVANGSILPRENGVSEKPLKNNAIKFISPKELEMELELPFQGKIKGMGIKKGITLIIGGGYHGKSTLLKSLELGVYNHISGDGREFVITDDSAVKVRAEDGRSIEKVDISIFINNLPNEKDTTKFSTENASGSTSQGASIVEAIECGTKLLLLDEDTSATNFMIRDEKMRQIVSNNKEPITPFIQIGRKLYEDLEVSTIMVVGSSGEYFNIADNVIMMDKYKTIDVTIEAKKLCETQKINNKNIERILKCKRILKKDSFKEGTKRVKIKTLGKDGLYYDKSEINLRYVEQLVSISQVNAIGEIIKYIKDNMVNDKLTILEIIEKIFKSIETNNLDLISSKSGVYGNLAMPRKYEVMAALNRFRELKIKKI